MSADQPRVRRKVLMVIPELGYGGAETSFVRLSNLLAQHHDVTIALFRRHYIGGGYAHGGLEPHCPVVLIDDTVNASASPKRWWRRWSQLRDLKCAHDVTISFLSGTNLLNAITPTDSATIISERGSKLHDVGRSRLNGWIWTQLLDRLTYRLADRVTSVSHGLSGEIEQTIGHGSRSKIVTIEGSTDSAQIVTTADLPIEPELEQLSGTPLLVACGRLHIQKGLQHLIPIFGDVKQDVVDARLLIIGDGPDRADLLALCAVHGLRVATSINEVLRADVIFLGHRDSPNRYFRLARTFVLSSIFEGLPNSLIEALAAGVPCMATDCPWGPRSVLALEPHRWVDATLPAQLDHGTLMPKIEHIENRTVWVTMLAAALRDESITRATHAQRMATVRRFDIQVTGQTWLHMIDELCAHNVPSAA